MNKQLLIDELRSRHGDSPELQEMERRYAGDNLSVQNIKIDPEISAKKVTSYILGEELGIEPNDVDAGYSSIVRNVYGEELKPSAVQKRMQDDGFLANPQNDEEEINIIAKAAIEYKDPPQDLMAKMYRRNLIKQTSNIAKKLDKDEESLFYGPTIWAANIANKPDEPNILTSMPEYADEDLLDISTYKSLLEQAVSKQEVDMLRKERKSLVHRLFAQTVQEQDTTLQEMSDFTTGSKVGDVTLEAAKGLYTALNTMARGTWSTSVAMGMTWNQPSLDAIDEVLASTKLTPIKAAGKIGYVVNAMSSAIPSFAYNMTVGNSGIFVVEYGNAYQDALNNGATENQANLIATPVATINTIIESMQIEKIYKFAEGGKGAKDVVKKMIKDRAYKVFLKSGAKFTGESIKTAINEGIEGGLQQGVSLAVPAFVLGVYPKDKKGNVDWVEVGGQIGQSFIGEGLGGLFLGGVGGIYNARQIQGYKNTLAAHIITDEGLDENQSLEIATNIVERLKNKDGDPRQIYREEIGKVKMADNRHKATAHIISKGKGMGDDQYRQIAMNTTGKSSMVDMNYDEAERFIDALRVTKVEKIEKVEGEEEKPEGDIMAEIQAIKDEAIQPSAAAVEGQTPSVAAQTTPEIGGEVIAYHGTTEKAGKSIETKGFKPKITNGQFYGSGVYLSPTEEGAAQYGEKVLPIKTNLKKPYLLDMDKYRSIEEWYNEIQPKIEFPLLDDYGSAITVHTLDLEGGKLSKLKPEATQAADAITNHLQEQGYDGLIVKEGGKTSEIVVFDPQNVSAQTTPPAEAAKAEPPAVAQGEVKVVEKPKILNMAGEVRTVKLKSSAKSDLSKVNPKTIEAIDNAILNRDSGTLKKWLHLGNKNSRKYFTEKTGVKLPKTERDTKVALDEFSKTPLSNEEKAKLQEWLKTPQPVPVSTVKPSEETTGIPEEVSKAQVKTGKPRHKRGGFFGNTPFGEKALLEKQIDELLGIVSKQNKKTPVLIIPDKEKKLRDLKRTSKTQAIKIAIEDVQTGIDRAFGLMSTRLKNISPKLFQEVRNRYINSTKILIAERTQEAHPFIDNINKKLSDIDRYDFEVAQWQADTDTIQRIVSDNGLEEEYEQYRSMLDLVYHEGNAVGMGIDYQTAYFPSAVKDFKGLMNELNSLEEYAPIILAMKEAQKKKGRALNKDEQVQMVDSLLRGFRVSGLTLSKPGFAKERTLLRQDIGLKKYYYGFEEATSRYIETMTEAIQARKFFGKTTKELVDLRAGISRIQTNIARMERDTTKDHKAAIKRANTKLETLQTELDAKDDKLLDNSVGTYVLDLVMNGTIKYNQQIELQQIFEGIFKTTSSNKLIHTLRSLEYAGSLSQIPAIVTQYSEIVLSILKAPISTLPNFVRANLGKSKIKLRDIGVAHIGQEWIDADLDKTIVALLKPFEFADKVGKETFINSVIDKYRKMAIKNPENVKKELSKYYPDEAFDSLINSLKSGEIDNNIKGFALNELADVQPISKMEVPELYAKAGNLRVFYMYKTFVLKRIDIIRNQAYNEIKTGIKSGDNKRTLKGIARLIWLAFMFTLADSGADAVKDIIRGKPLNTIDNYVIDNLLQMILLSKYSMSKLPKEGISSFFKDNIMMPVSNIDSAVRDLYELMFVEDSEKGSETVKRIPWIGDLYYWYMGEGARKVEEGIYDKE